MILNDLNFTITEGNIVGLVGPNGAGKTTLVKSLCGLTKLTCGEASVNGNNILHKPYTGRYEIGVCFQENIFDRFFNIYDMLLHNAMYHGLNYQEAKWATEDILIKVKLSDKRYAMGSTLSGGMKRRFQLAIALVHNPALLILDEPTAGIDLGLVDEIYTLIFKFMEQRGKMILLTSHNVQELSYLCSQVLFMQNGCIKQREDKVSEAHDLEAMYRRLYLDDNAGTKAVI